MGGPMRIELTGDEALVLFELLSRYYSSDSLSIEDQAERRTLWNLHCQLEKQLVEPFQPDYGALLRQARDRLRDTTD
jgi:hypothetical protein